MGDGSDEVEEGDESARAEPTAGHNFLNGEARPTFGRRITSYPVPDHPELSRLESRGEQGSHLAVEYRLRCRAPSVWALFAGWTLVILGGWASWRYVMRGDEGQSLRWAVALVVMMVLCDICLLQTVEESVLALPGLGIQLSNTTGLSLPLRISGTRGRSHRTIALTRKTRFVPLFALSHGVSSVILHEGVRRWSVEFYLALLGQTGSGVADVDGEGGEALNEVHVIFATLRPRLPVLQEVYHGLRETMWDDYTDADTDGAG